MDLSSPQLPGELDYDEPEASTSWAENTPAQRAAVAVSLPLLTVLTISCGLLGNGTALGLLGFRIKRGPFAVYILNKIAADLLFLFFHFVTIMGKLLFPLRPDSVFLILTGFCDSASENLLGAMSTEHCLSVLCPVCYGSKRPKHTSAILCSFVWFLTILSCASGYFICQHLSSSEACEEFMEGGLLWLPLHLVSLILVLCVLCRRCRCPEASTLRVLLVLITLELLLNGLPFVLGKGNVLSLMDEIGFTLFCGEATTVTVRIEDDTDVLLSCLENSVDPFTYFFVACCKQRREGESLRVLLQRTLLAEEGLEDGTEIISGSGEDVTLSLRIPDRTSEEAMRGDAAL
ncbi:mas-related G-protein coupled receptor member X1-like [Dromiciops gliroides]|uniref:mas-related G-protein coupled receptor member X1-like n=1 Tax=Dromiciops gliroides TaxID=33562 RepID=UPI001CC5F487|nr:mas-related G-protein coupled receptor member X1-like [Dromiciops gliroides]